MHTPYSIKVHNPCPNQQHFTADCGLIRKIEVKKGTPEHDNTLPAVPGGFWQCGQSLCQAVDEKRI